MTHPTALSVRRALPALGLATLLLALVSCEEASLSPCDTFAVGAVEGRVLVCGEPVAVRVGARALEGLQRGLVVASTTAGPDGRYRLDLPSGPYRLVIDPDSGGHISSDPRDTLRIGREVLEHDLLRGRADVSVQMPPEFEGVRFKLWIRSDLRDSDHQDLHVEDGRLDYAFPILQPGDYTMELVEIGQARHRFHLPDATDDEDGDLLTVALDAPSEYSVDLSGALTTLSGAVSGANVAAGVSPRVSVYDPDRHWIYAAYCEDDGSFECRLLVRGPVRLLIEHDDVQRWYGGDDEAGAEVFELAPGVHHTDLSLENSGFRLTLDGPGDQIVDEFGIRLVDDAGVETLLAGVRDNPASLCLLAPGAYRIRVDGHCYGQRWAARWLEGGEPIVLAPGELRDLVVELEPGGALAGRILQADGEAPGFVKLSVRDADGRPLCDGWREWSLFEQGRFRFEGLADGDYRLVATAAGGVDWWYPGTADPAASTLLTIEDHATLEALEWSLPPTGEVSR